MKLTVRYESEDRDNLVLRFTLGEKHLSTMSGTKLLDMFAKQFEKKFDTKFDGAGHYIKPVGGNKVREYSALISDYCNPTEQEIYILEHGTEPRVGGAAESSSKKKKSDSDSSDDSEAEKPAQKAQKTAAKTPETILTKKSPAELGQLQTADSSNKPTAAAQNSGQVRCKNFGCNQYYDPNDNENPHACRHHISPPIFHETAKWWSCCPNTKAYDWEEFQRIPGCTTGVHSAVAAKKQVLGGCDLRDANAPQRLDEGPMDPRKKLEMLRKAMITVGVDEDVFDKSWGRLSAKHSNLGTVCKVMKVACEKALQNASEIDAVDIGDSGEGLEDMD